MTGAPAQDPSRSLIRLVKQTFTYCNRCFQLSTILTAPPPPPAPGSGGGPSSQVGVAAARRSAVMLLSVWADEGAEVRINLVEGCSLALFA